METSPKCSFCDKSQRDVCTLIASPARLVGFDKETALFGSTAFICDECVDVCLDMIAGPRASPGVGVAEGTADAPSRAPKAKPKRSPKKKLPAS